MLSLILLLSMSISIVERRVGSYLVSTDPSRLDFAYIHQRLSKDAYWSLGRSRDAVEQSFQNSKLVCGAYHGENMVGFGRMVTDLTTFGWLCDVYIDKEHRRQGLGVALTQTLVEHPAVASMKRQIVATDDAHELYQKFGYDPLPKPSQWMVRLGSDK